MESSSQHIPPVPNTQEMPAPPPSGGNVGFPGQQSSDNKKDSGGRGGIMKWVFALIVLVVIIFGGIFAVRNFTGGEGEEDAAPTPDTLSSFATPSTAPTPTSTATPTPKPKGEVKIEILNGTGAPGEASYLKEQLEDLGFSDINAGNADEQEETRTTFSFNKDLSDEYVTEITKALEEIYEEVRVRRSSLSDYDISITTGPRKGSTSETSDDTDEEDASPTPQATQAAGQASPSPTPGE